MIPVADIEAGRTELANLLGQQARQSRIAIVVCSVVFAAAGVLAQLTNGFHLFLTISAVVFTASAIAVGTGLIPVTGPGRYPPERIMYLQAYVAAYDANASKAPLGRPRSRAGTPLPVTAK